MLSPFRPRVAHSAVHFARTWEPAIDPLLSYMVRFWGVRGSASCAGPEWARYGGNTACVEVRCGERLLIFDAGTGLQRLGVALRGQAVDADMLLSHTHLDHVSGIPFFGPFYDPRSTFRLHAGHLRPEHSIDEALQLFMAPPLFPVPPAVFAAKIVHNDFVAGTVLDLGQGIIVRTQPLHHPNRATAYRVEYLGKSVCYVTDTEHVPGELDAGILDLIRGADVVIYDCTYTDAEYPAHVGWGHSTWEQGVRLCDAAGAAMLVIFHHDPAHDDGFMDGIAAEAAMRRPGTVVAREGMVVNLLR